MDVWVNKAMQSDFLNVGHKSQYCYNNKNLSVLGYLINSSLCMTMLILYPRETITYSQCGLQMKCLKCKRRNTYKFKVSK